MKINTNLRNSFGSFLKHDGTKSCTLRVVILTEWTVMHCVLCGQVADLGRVCEHGLLQHVDTDTALCLLSIADQFQSTTLKVETSLTPITESNEINLCERRPCACQC